MHVFHLLLQMSAHTWIQTALLGLLMLHSVASQTCSTPFEAVFAAVTETVLSPATTPNVPQMTYYTETLGFTAEEAEQQLENAIQHFNTQFGIDFSDVEPNEANERLLPTATFSPNMNAANFTHTIVANRWIVSGNRRSRCFPMSIGFFVVNFNATTMLHGVYGGEEGIPVSAGDALSYGHMAIFGASAQQPIVIQAQNNIPCRRTPVEGWVVDELQLYNRQLGRGRAQSVFKSAPSPDDPTMIALDIQIAFSFP